MDEGLAHRAADLALAHLASIRDRPVREDASPEQLRAALGVALDEDPLPAAQVLEELAAAAQPGVIGSQSPRFYGFVIGGSLDSALAADWLTTAWDQNAGIYPIGPSAAVAEDVAGRWLLDLFGLPEDAGFGFTTGCQMAHVTALSVARRQVLGDWDVDNDGLFGAPPIRVVVGAKAHATVFAALRMLGLGSRRVDTIAVDGQGRMRVDELRLTDEPTIVIAQAGEVNTGAFDNLQAITTLCREHGAWCHVDGAFGLWAAAAPSLRHLIAGVEDADSWTTDGHKWLNVPYDCGIAIVRDAAAHAAAMNPFAGAAYIPPPVEGKRDASTWVPEFSRRARGFTVYAALRELGRRGVADLVERCCAHARLMAELLREGGLEILNEVVLNQVLVRYSAERLTALQQEGTCWMSGTTWGGEHAMRISVSNWRTTEDDIRRSAEVILS